MFGPRIDPVGLPADQVGHGPPAPATIASERSLAGKAPPTLPIPAR